MKKILYLSLFAIVALLASCDDDATEGISRITEYPIITVLGDELIYVEKGSTFVDPGATSSGGEEVKIDVVDTNKPGIYTVEYAAVNPDGLDGVSTRTVVVYEEDGILAGVYDGIRVSRGYGGMVLIYTNGDGTYSCTDLLGGYYEYGAGYGRRYSSATSKMELVGNVITADPGADTPWGPWDLSDGEKNGDVLTWKTTLIGDGFGFDVQLTKKTIE